MYISKKALVCACKYVPVDLLKILNSHVNLPVKKGINTIHEKSY